MIYFRRCGVHRFGSRSRRQEKGLVLGFDDTLAALPAKALAKLTLAQHGILPELTRVDEKHIRVHGGVNRRVEVVLPSISDLGNPNGSIACAGLIDRGWGCCWRGGRRRGRRWHRRRRCRIAYTHMNGARGRVQS